jgi:hypothetical protein
MVVHSNVDAIIKDSNGDNLALRATYGKGKILFLEAGPILHMILTTM